MKIAFKEWAAVCAALGSGRQTVILRKGGIADPAGEFRPEHDRFLLLPTWLHQSAAGLVDDARPLFERSLAEKGDGSVVPIRHFAIVQDAVLVRSLAALAALRSEHVWAEGVVNERFHRWNKESVYALVVRVFALPAPVELPMRDEYAGCKSWVELDRDIPTAAATPVLTDGEFEHRHAAIRAALGIGGQRSDATPA